jgi:ABC-2 type transport system ATP-binding protein
MTHSDHASVLTAIEISKRYGKRRAVDGVSLNVRPGEIVGLLGPNGAGKTTTLAMLSTVLQPDSGQVLIDGKPARTHRRHRGQMLGLVPQLLALYPTLSAAQNVWHFARMQGLSRHEAGAASVRALEEVGLSSRARDPMYSLSGGMKRRLNLACGIVHRPAALLLDEPTVGVDLESREQILTLVRRAADAGSGVMYSTHYMEEAERICDRVLLIDRGTLVADGRVDELIALAGGRPRMELAYRGQLAEDWLRTLDGVRELSASGGEGKLALEMTSLAQVNEVLQSLKDSGVQVIDFSLHSPNLSDAFIALTGRTLRDTAQDAG